MEQLEQVEASATKAGVPDIPVSSVWRTLGNYIFWNYPRGSIHYDIMVTLILIFIFVTPLFVNFNDKPVEHSPHPRAVLVLPDGERGLLYQVPVAAVSGNTDAAVRNELRQILVPIAGQVSISKYERTLDAAGEPVYQVRVKR